MFGLFTRFNQKEKPKEKSEAEKIEDFAIEYLSSFDLSHLPYDMRLSLVHGKDVPDDQKVGQPTDYAVKINAVIQLVDGSGKAPIHNFGMIPDITSKQAIRKAALSIIYTIWLHELSENIIVGGKRIMDPHHPNYKCEFTVSADTSK